MANIKEDFKANTILHFGLISGQIMIALILIGLQGTEDNASDGGLIMILIPCIISIGTMAASGFIYKKLVNQLDLQKLSLEEKLTNFRSTSIVRWAMLEGGNLIVIIIAWLFGNTWLLLLFAVSLFLLYLARPSVENFVKDFQLSREEESKLRSTLR